MGLGITTGLKLDENGKISAFTTFTKQIEGARTIRADKGKSLLEFPVDYVCIDLETTGLDPKYDDIIEVAAVRYVNAVEVDRFQSLVNPQYEISDFITSLTGITNEMLVDAPLLSDVLPQYLAFVGDTVIVGHNVNFDINFIYDKSLDLFDKPFSNNYVDTMRLGRRLHKDLPNHKLQTLVTHYGIADNVEHRALSDVINTTKCFEYLRSYINEKSIDLSLFSKGSEFRTKDIQASTTEFDETHPVYGKTFVFTGVLEKMIRKEAMQIVVNLGGLCGDNVNKNTNYLVLGNNDYCKTIKDGKSTKQKKAEQLKLNDCNIEIVSENVFYDMCSAEFVVNKNSGLADLAQQIRFIFEKNELDISAFRVKENVGYVSMFLFDKLSMKLNVVNKRVMLSISDKNIDGFFTLIQENNITLSKTQSNLLWSRLDITGVNLNSLTSLFVSLYESVECSMSKNSFDCCHLYAECSDALECISPYTKSARLCGYRQKLKKGIVFYGENRNV